eukprot:GEMP01017270.1.p1 GENE.GEMP01017270.1~~GEMP01017270.1.p1  ORF type:complete len:633 (+),score=136.06 GEMP01017270.1:29-1900(+)
MELQAANMSEQITTLNEGGRLNEVLEQKQAELDRMKLNYTRLQKQFDHEVMKREKAEGDTALLERQVVDAYETKLVPAKVQREADVPDALQASSKIFRAIDHWMRYKNLSQALLRNSALTDIAFSTLSQMLHGCPSLHTIDLSRNQLTMDSCSDICQLITVMKELTYVSVESNGFSLRSLGYFMTAILERQNTEGLAPLDLFDFQHNDGLLLAMEEPAPGPDVLKLWPILETYQNPIRLVMVAIAKVIWRFLHDTGHPQVKGTPIDPPAFQELDDATLEKIRAALSKILLIDDNQDVKRSKAYTADMAVLILAEPAVMVEPEKDEKTVQLPPIQKQMTPQSQLQNADAKKDWPAAQGATLAKRDTFIEMAAQFEKPKEKYMTFNLKQILTKNSAVLMNMLERLLETTSINARDVETQQTLLEYACHHGNMGLAKLCYRRGANLNGRTVDGNTPFNIALENRRYDLLEFLHMYGVKVNSDDAEGRTGLHVAAARNDIDAICRLIEWGADANLRDKKKRTPLHMAAIGGHEKVAMLLLELGADINAKDEREFTAVAHAEAHDKFKLMDRLVLLGGLGHGLQKSKSAYAIMDTVKLKTAMNKNMGQLPVTAGVRKRSCLARLGKHK